MRKYKKIIMLSALLILLGTITLCGGGGTNGAIVVGIPSLL